MRAASKLALVVLCGGKSQRMGESKALTDVAGEAMLTRIIRRMTGPFSKTIVVAAAGQRLPRLPPGVEVVRDTAPGRGPLQGLADGLTAAATETDWAFVCTTDVPFVSAEFALALIAAGAEPQSTAQKRAATAVHDGRYLHPLTAVYSCAVAKVAREMLEAGDRKPRLLLERVGFTRCELAALYGDEDLARRDPDRSSLRNVNTPEELAAARHDIERGSQVTET